MMGHPVEVQNRCNLRATRLDKSSKEAVVLGFVSTLRSFEVILLLYNMFWSASNYKNWLDGII